MPQILKLAGMQSYWFQRGVPDASTPSEFIWKGIDGSTVPAFWLATSYGPLANLPPNLGDFAGTVDSAYHRLDPFSRVPDRVLFAGADVWEPEEVLPRHVTAFNALPGRRYELQLAVPRDFEAAMARRSGRPVIAGELNPVFQGIYSTRIDVKQAMRRSEQMLLTAEKLGVLAGWLGAREDPDAEEQAWEPVLFNEAHDLASGVMVDKVYDDSMMGFDRSRHLTAALTDAYFDTIARHIDTSGDGVPVIVYNPLAWSRTDIAEGDVAFSEPGVKSFTLMDAAGKPVVTQSLSALRNTDGDIRQARIVFVAREVPSLGYAVYHAVPNASVKAAPPELPAGTSTQHFDQGTLENEFYRATFNLWNGDLTHLTLKENGWEVLSAPANVAREYDGGDFWELYGTLNGGRFTAMHKPIGLPRPQFTQWSSDFVGGNGSTRPGPVFSEFRITHPLGKNQFSTRVRLYNGLRRIDIQTQIVNQEEFVRYRALLPTTIRQGTRTSEIPFGAIQRPTDSEYPAQNWVDWSDAGHGLTVINRGLPGNNVSSGVMMLSLMRSTRLIAYGYSGGFEPGVGSDSALGIGRRFTHDYALVPHAGSWRESLPWRTGLEFNHPLLVRAAAHHPGKLPSRWGLLEVSNPAVVVSSVKPGRKGLVIVRLYEASGLPATGVHFRSHAGITQLNEANLIEDPGAAVPFDNSGWTATFRPYEIKTYAVRLSGRR